MINYLSRDLFMNALAFVLFLVALLIPYINPIPTPKDDVPPPGQIFVKITWPAGNDDVDLWLASPTDQKGVGFTRKDGSVWALLRDDLGSPDIDINEEYAFARSLPTGGRWVINLHLYRLGTKAPIDVHVEVIILAQGKRPHKFFDETVTLYSAKQERTAVSFEIDENGLVPFSANKVFVPVRAAK